MDGKKIDSNRNVMDTESSISTKKHSLWSWLLPRLFDAILIIVMITATLMFLQNKDPHKSIFGYRYYFIRSGSMEPELPIGSFILVKMTDAEEVHVGDNIAFYLGDETVAEPEFWTHKVIEVVKNEQTIRVQTQGIANDKPDPFILEAENIVGKVVYCNKYLGPIAMSASENPLPILAVIGAFFLLLHVISRYRRK